MTREVVQNNRISGKRRRFLRGWFKALPRYRNRPIFLAFEDRGRTAAASRSGPL